MKTWAVASLLLVACSSEREPRLPRGTAAAEVSPAKIRPDTCAPPGSRRVLSGRGTANVDGMMTLGEWARADSITFLANLPRGGTAAATLFVMNDDHDLFVALRFPRTVVDPRNSLVVELDNDDDCIHELGDDVWLMNPELGGLLDSFRTNVPPCPPGSGPVECGFADAEHGGTNEGDGAFLNDGGFTVYEIGHPIDSGDGGHDIALKGRDKVGLYVFLRMLVGPNFPADFGDTTFPDFGFLEVALTRAGDAGSVCARPTKAAAPRWKKEAYFPSFPPAKHLYVLPVETDLHDQQSSWQEAWRISDSTETMDALTLVGMQGVINRETPCVYLDWYDPPFNGAADWLPNLGRYVTLDVVPAQGATAIDFLYQRFSDRFKGAVVYDPQIPDTINVATMLAGLEDRIILAPQQLGVPGIPSFSDVVDLRVLAATQGWDTSEPGKLRLYQWVHDQLWPRLDHRLLGVVSPGPPTGRPIPGANVWNPLGLAARDYLIALRSTALWLTSFEPSQTPLYEQFLAEASSPIVVTGGDDEEPTVRLASAHGDWEAAMNWPNAPLSAGNLTALGAIAVAVKPYVAVLDEARILATLGNAPVTTMFSSDGDNIQYQWERGFSGPFGFQWEDVQGHPFGWTTNPTLADLSPLMWNHYVETADQVTFVAGLSGTGYMYPGLMSATDLTDYLLRADLYQRRTGIRVLQIDSRHTQIEDVMPSYYRYLEGSRFLGAFYGFGGLPVIGLSMVWGGAPTPAVVSVYATQPASQILAELPARRLGDFSLRMAEWPHLANSVGELVSDPGATNGQALRYRANLTACCLAFNSTNQLLPPGTYTASFRLRVADNSSTSLVVAIRSFVNSGSAPELGRRDLRPTDFAQAGQYQTFSYTFTLTELTANVVFWMEYLPGVTDVYASDLTVTRPGPDLLPVFAPIWIQLVGPVPPGERPRNQFPTLTDELTAAGVVVLTPDEFMAALNPEYMIGLAAKRLGPTHPAVTMAQAQLAAGRYLDALLSARAALR